MNRERGFPERIAPQEARMTGKALFLLMSLGMLVLVQAALSADTSYRVCVGSFADERNAARALAAFQAAGFAFCTENAVVNGSLRWRVTTGDVFTNVGDAVRESARIASSDTAKALGTGCPWYVEYPASPEYAVCLGSFLAAENAASFARALSAKGIPTFTRSTLMDNRTWLRVIFARTFSGVDSARETAKKLRANGVVRASGGGTPWVMKDNMPLDTATKLPSVPSVAIPSTNQEQQPLSVSTTPVTNALNDAVSPTLPLPAAGTNPALTLVTNSASVVTNTVSINTNTTNSVSSADLLTNMPAEVTVPLTNSSVTNSSSTNSGETSAGSTR
jgi:cell division septation protein DedD